MNGQFLLSLIVISFIGWKMLSVSFDDLRFELNQIKIVKLVSFKAVALSKKLFQ